MSDWTPKGGWNCTCSGTSKEYKSLTAENARLKEGMKGDYDLDAWLDWAVNAEKLISDNARLRDMLNHLYIMARMEWPPEVAEEVRELLAQE